MQVYFTVYERLKTTIGSRVGPKHAHSAGVHMAAAACAGAATMVITNPLWVIKTRLQVRPVLLPGFTAYDFLRTFLLMRLLWVIKTPAAGALISKEVLLMYTYPGGSKPGCGCAGRRAPPP